MIDWKLYGQNFLANQIAKYVKLKIWSRINKHTNLMQSNVVIKDRVVLNDDLVILL